MARQKRGYTLRNDGLIQYRFSINKERYSVYGHTFDECERKKDELKERLRQGLLISNDNITLSEYYEVWESKKRKIRESTKYCNRTRWQHIDKALGKFRVVDIKPIHVERFQARLREELSTTGVNHAIDLLRSVLRGAVNARIIMQNPCDQVENYERVEVEATDSNHRALEVEEQKLFFEYAKDSWYYELFAFMVSTGVRIGEAAALDWSDIDLQNNMIHITKTLSRISNTEYVISKPKTKNSKRDIPLTDQVKDILKTQREKNKVLSIYRNKGKVIEVGGRIFSSVEGGYLMRASVNSCIDNVLKHIKEQEHITIDHFSSHAFRATFATRAIEQGMQPQTLKTILGHSKLAITMDLYAHVLPNTKQDEMSHLVIAI